MPPRTRSGRAEKLEAQALLKSGRANVAGLAAVPPEILVNIISHFSCIPTPYTGIFRSYFPQKYLERLETLQALSKTCKRLRSVVLPILWEKVEVAVRRYNGKDRGFEKRLATELVRQLEIVTVRDPTLAPYVREVNVCLSEYSQATVFPELVRALNMFPNMRALQIFSSAYYIENEIIKAFSGHTFPNVKFYCTTVANFNMASYHWNTIIRHSGWKALSEVHGLVVSDKHTLALIVAKLPDISYLEIEAKYILEPSGFLEVAPLLWMLKNLQVIKFIAFEYVTGGQYAAAKANIASGLAKLQSTSSQDYQEKSIIIEFRKGAGNVRRLFEEKFGLGASWVGGS